MLGEGGLFRKVLPRAGFYSRHQRMWRALRNMLTGSALRQRASELASRVAVLLPAALPHGEEARDAPHVQWTQACLLLNGAHSDRASCAAERG